ncbi:MAG: hypothetical protein J1E34_06550 [Oscillospiraceae bacterium]|nr:hypothetical protein [Oscillospiraceae bacterium]
MDKEHLSDAIGNIKDEYIESARIKNNRSKSVLNAFLALAAVIALAVTAVIIIPRLLPSDVTPDITSGTQSTDNAETDNSEQDTSEPDTEVPSPQPDYLSYAKINAVYPDYPDYYFWYSESEDKYNYSSNTAANYSLDFYKNLIGEFFGNDSDENSVFSPLSVFFSLATLAEITDGETRDQILSLLHIDNLEDLRELSRATWLSIYTNGDFYELGTQQIVPANSFWLNSAADVSGDEKIAEILKNDYFTSFFKGDPNDENFVSAYKDWINTNTGGLLEDQMDNWDFSPEDIFQLVNTLLLKVDWFEPFNAENNFTAVFHGKKSDALTEYMFGEDYTGGKYYETDDFIAASIQAKANAEVWFVSPKDYITVDDLIKSGTYTDLLRAMKDEDSSAFAPPEGYDIYSINFTIPKFDISSQFDLKEKLINLGVTDVFDETKAEIPFITMKDGSNLCITGAEQNVRLSINEQGVSAAAATMMLGGWGSPTFKYVDFVLDRPFMVFITFKGAPLFAGVINDLGE